MKVSGFLMAGGAAFYGLIAVIYWFITKELVGSTALALTGGLAFLIGYYLLFTSRRVGQRAEDNPDASQADAEGDYGHFHPHSWWPLAVAGGGAITFVGLAVGWWLAIIGIFLLVLSVVGWVFEGYHGEYAQ